jgi:hypothetical protein
LRLPNFGYIDIGGLERKLQIKVADFTEDLCKVCLEESPEDILGSLSWETLQRNRSVYKDAEVLELTDRIVFLKKRHTQKESLDCPCLNISEHVNKIQTYCPICEGNEATVAFELGWDVDFDVQEQIVWAVDPYPKLLAFTCACGFTLEDHDEAEILFDQYEDKYEATYDEMNESILHDYGKIESKYAGG